MSVGAKNSLSITTGIFCEPFSAGNAIAALLESGFSEVDIQAVGVLEGQGRAAEELLQASGIGNGETTLYSQLFEDGALLVIVRLDEQGTKHRVAADVLKKHGGVHTRSQTLYAQDAEARSAAMGESGLSGAAAAEDVA